MSINVVVVFYYASRSNIWTSTWENFRYLHSVRKEYFRTMSPNFTGNFLEIYQLASTIYYPANLLWFDWLLDKQRGKTKREIEKNCRCINLNSEWLSHSMLNRNYAPVHIWYTYLSRTFVSLRFSLFPQCMASIIMT